MESINKRSYMQKLKAYKRNPISLVLSLLVMLSFALFDWVYHDQGKIQHLKRVTTLISLLIAAKKRQQVG